MSLKILGVTITDKLSMSEHVRDVVLKCAQSLHVINVLHRHGMNDQALQAVYRSVALAKLLYASSAWWGFTMTDDRHRIEAVIRRGVRPGLFRRPNARLYVNPVPISEVQQVTSAKLLGITLCDTLRFDAHIGNVLKMFSQRIYLLKLLRDQGLPRHYLNNVFDALVLSRLRYAIPASINQSIKIYFLSNNN